MERSFEGRKRDILAMDLSEEDMKARLRKEGLILEGSVGDEFFDRALSRKAKGRKKAKKKRARKSRAMNRRKRG